MRVLTCLACLLSLVAAPVRLADRDALWRLYELAGGASWRFRNNWSPTGDPCSMNKRWPGVGCVDPCDRYRDGRKRDGETCRFGRVASIVLDFTGANGSISDWTDVGELTNLTVLDLTGNSLSGTLPTELGLIDHLQYFSFQRNRLEGTLPTQLGLINSRGGSELTLPSGEAYGEASVLHDFSVAYNSISGTIPSSLGEHKGLASLNLRANRLSGALPSSLAGLGNLQTLYAQDNPLEGTLPDDLSGLSSLRYLDVARSASKGGGVSGSLPSSIGTLRLLQALHLEQNAFSGSLPSELTEMPLLRTLKLSDNRFSGEIPSAVGKLFNLEVLDLFNNSMVGDVPTSIRDLFELRDLYLDKQHLLPLRKRYCGQRLPDLGRYNYRIIREEYDQMMASYCPEGEIHDTDFTFSTLQDSGVYEQ